MEFRRLAITEASSMVDRLVAAVAAEVENTAARTQAAADSTLSAVRAELAQVTSALEQARADHKNLQSTVDELRSHVKTLQTSLNESSGERQVLEQTLQKTLEEAKALQETIRQMQAGEAMRLETIVALEAAVEKGRERCAAVDARLEQLAAEKAAASEEHDKAMAAWFDEARAMREAGAKSAAAELAHLRSAFERLDAASTVAEGLNVLASSLKVLFSRVALFHVHGGRLVGGLQTGTKSATTTSHTVPLTKGTAIAEAVQSGRAHQLSREELRDANSLPFGGDPSTALLLPVSLEGGTIAMLYADDSGQNPSEHFDPQRVAISAEVLVLHSIPMLSRLSAQEKTAAYERQLLSELKIV